MASRKNFPNRVEKRKADALARQESYSKLTTEHKLQALANRGFTSGREVSKLRAKLSKQ